MKELKGTKTEQNLKEAFAGESMARNKYTYFASNTRILLLRPRRLPRSVPPATIRRATSRLKLRTFKAIKSHRR